MKRYKVTVIVPVYNIAQFVGRCVESLMTQTLDNVEFIIVNDASTDESIDVVACIIAQYPNRSEDVRILTHETNQGLPSARNTGLSLATGDYVFHCDGDDWVEQDILEKLYAEAEKADADFVWCDWWLSFEGNERYMRQPKYNTRDEVVKGMLCGTMKYNVWNKLARRSLYDGISFPESKAMGEDMTMIRIASKAHSVAYVPKALYHYQRTNAEAMTQTYSDKKLEELRWNVQSTIDYLKATYFGKDIDTDIVRFCLNVKLPFLFTGNRNDIKRWREWYSEANKGIMKNTNQPLRTRLIQWCAANGMAWPILMYYQMVYKTIYGRIYK